MLATILGIVFCIVCVLLIVVILLQRGRGGGLAGAFGGAGGHSAFGAKTGDVFTWVTVALTGVFLLLAIVANFVFEPEKFTGPSEQAQPAPATGQENVPPTTDASKAATSETQTPPATQPAGE